MINNGQIKKNEDKNEKNGKIVRENTTLKKLKKSREKMKKSIFFNFFFDNFL